MPFKVVLETILQNFQNCERGQWVFSPTFVDGCIGIFCQPQSDGIIDDELSLGVEFYKLPEKCEYLSAEIELKTNIKDENGEFYVHNTIENYITIGSTVNVDYTRFTCQMFQGLSVDKLIFSAKIDIKNVRSSWSMTTSCHDRADWVKYGIIDVGEK